MLRIIPSTRHTRTNIRKKSDSNDKTFTTYSSLCIPLDQLTTGYSFARLLVSRNIRWNVVSLNDCAVCPNVKKITEIVSSYRAVRGNEAATAAEIAAYSTSLQAHPFKD
jgi:hypothetical protein